MGGKDSGGSQDYMAPQRSTMEHPEAALEPLPGAWFAPERRQAEQPQQGYVAKPLTRDDPAMDPNAVAGGGGIGPDATLGDAAAQSVHPTKKGKHRGKRGPPVVPPPTGGQV